MNNSNRPSRYYTPILYSFYDPTIPSTVFVMNPQVISLIKNEQIRLFARAIYPYGPGADEFDDDTLELKEGQMLEITEVDQSGWCWARYLPAGKIGLIPGNYV